MFLSMLLRTDSMPISQDTGMAKLSHTDPGSPQTASRCCSVALGLRGCYGKSEVHVLGGPRVLLFSLESGSFTRLWPTTIRWPFSCDMVCSFMSRKISWILTLFYLFKDLFLSQLQSQRGTRTWDPDRDQESHSLLTEPARSPIHSKDFNITFPSLPFIPNFSSFSQFLMRNMCSECWTSHFSTLNTIFTLSRPFFTHLENKEMN